MKHVICLLLLLMFSAAAHAALPVGEQWREEIIGNFGGVDRRVGYGRNATGGAGGTLCTVSNLNDSGAGSLRSCLMAAGPQWVIFSVSGTINLNTQIWPLPPNGGNKTIDGRGANITITSATTDGTPALLLSGHVDNWIIHNVSWRISTIGNPNGSFLIRILCVKNIWMDHLDIAGAGTNIASLSIGAHGGDCDPDVDTDWSGDITISYSKFHTRCYISPTLCSSGHIVFGTGSIGNPVDNPFPDIGFINNAFMTLHHNWYQMSGHVRFPMMRFGWNHSFNNYLDNTDQGMYAQEQGQFLSEHDIFDCTDGYGGVCNDTVGWVCKCGATGGALPRVRCDWSAPTLEQDAANCKVVNPWLVEGGETYQQLNPGTIFNPATDYSYTLETANAALMAKITNPTMGAGHVSNPYNYLALSSATLVAHYAFDEGSGTTAQDSTVNNLDGTITAGTYVTPGRVGSSALSFNGTSSVVTVADNPLLDLTAGFTLAAWVRPAVAMTDFESVISRQGATTTYAYFLYGSGGGGSTNQPIGGFTSGTLQTVTAAPTLPVTPVWTHLAVTYDGVTLTLYRNGLVNGTPVAASGALQASTAALLIGNSHFGEFFQGAIDDVRIYDGALDAAEVLELAYPGLVAWWRLDETSGLSAADSSANGLTGTLTNMESPGDWVVGQIGNALQFDNSNTEYVAIADNALLSAATTGEFSVCAWIFPTSLPAFGVFVGKGTVGQYEYAIYVQAAGTVRFTLYTPAGSIHADVTSAATVAISAWSHVCGTYESTVETKIYIGGTSSGTSTAFSSTIADGTSPVNLGRRPDDVSYYNGVLDEVQVYDIALSATEVAALAVAVLDTTPPAAPTGLHEVQP